MNQAQRLRIQLTHAALLTLISRAPSPLTDEYLDWLIEFRAVCFEAQCLWHSRVEFTRSPAKASADDLLTSIGL